MNDIWLFVAGMIVFCLLLTGLVLTMVEFHRVTERPDLHKGADVGPRARSRRDGSV